MAGDLTSEAWQERLESLITDWSQEQVDYACGLVAQFLAGFTKKELYEEAMRRRQMLYPVQTVQDAADLDTDPQLAASSRRGEHYARMHHPCIGEKCRIDRIWRFRLSATPDVVQVPAPLLGQHNDYVLSELLGLSQADIDRLTMAGVVVAVT